jgi:hypothetical protein
MRGHIRFHCRLRFLAEPCCVAGDHSGRQATGIKGKLGGSRGSRRPKAAGA